ncbi:hypothetical protein EI94DRAFT_1734798 [Lactarius quietus]|nr:hypothetical protein EI94DRAFT_1734798 [Lactarius quietus]
MKFTCLGRFFSISRLVSCPLGAVSAHLSGPTGARSNQMMQEETKGDYTKHPKAEALMNHDNRTRTQNYHICNTDLYTPQSVPHQETTKVI